jgi:hypothetical protein
VGITDVLDVALSYGTKRASVQNAFDILLKGFALKGDILEFIENPFKRIDVVKKYNIFEERKEYKGRTESMAGLYYDARQDRIHFPKGVSEQNKSFILRDFRNPFSKIRANIQRFNKKWLNKIVRHYKNSRTTIILAKIPRVPLHTGRLDLRPGENSSLLEIATKNPENVLLFPDTVFDYLEKPEYFADYIHLNMSGRELFSKHIASIVHRSI